MKSLSREIDTKVAKEVGKVLSSNDFTDAYKHKLDNIEPYAQANTIEEVRVNNVALTRTGKAVNIAMADYLTDYYLKSETNDLLNGKEDKSNKTFVIGNQSTDQEYPSARAVVNYVKESITNVYKWSGAKSPDELNALEIDESMHGNVYNITQDGTLWDGEGIDDPGGIPAAGTNVNKGDNVAIVWDHVNSKFYWDKLVGAFTVDLSNYYTKSQINNKLQDYGKINASNTWTGLNGFTSGVTFASTVSFKSGSRAYFNGTLTFSEYTCIEKATDRTLIKLKTIPSAPVETTYLLPYIDDSQSKTYTLVTTDDLTNYATLSNLNELEFVKNHIYYGGPEFNSNKDVVEYWFDASANLFKQGDFVTLPEEEYPDRYCFWISEPEPDLEDLTGEAWRLNTNLDQSIDFDIFIDFECNGEKWNNLYLSGGELYFYYLDNEHPENEHDILVWDATNGWVDDKYKKIIFTGVAPTEDSENAEGFLEWLPDNAQIKKVYKFAALKAKSNGNSNVQVFNDVYIKDMRIIQENNFTMFDDGGQYSLERVKERYVYGGEEDGLFIRNDPKYTFLHVRSSYLDDYMIEQIELGNFVMRLDYPIIYHKKTYGHHTGRGHYSYARHFYTGSKEGEGDYAPWYENALIFVTPNDIRTDQYGNKSIYLKIPLVDLLNKVLLPEIRAEDSFFDRVDVGTAYYDLEGLQVGGAYQGPKERENPGYGEGYGFNDLTATKYSLEYRGQQDAKLINNPGETDFLYPFNHSPNKNNPLRHYWAPFVLKDPVGGPKGMQGRFEVVFYKTRYKHGLSSPNSYLNNLAMESCFKPRFCVINQNYRNINGSSVWVRKYSQFKKRMYIYCGQVFGELVEGDHHWDEDNTVDYDVGIFRFSITK